MTASIFAVVQLAGEMISYARTMKNATKEQKQLQADAAEVDWILTQLQCRVEEADPGKDWFKTVRLLAQPGGAFDQYAQALESLKHSEKDTSTFGGRIIHSVTWKFRKEDVERALMSIERVKSSADLALSNDLLCVLLYDV